MSITPYQADCNKMIICDSL